MLVRLRRLIALLLVVSLLWTSAPVPGYAEENGTPNSELTDSVEKVVVPETTEPEATVPETVAPSATEPEGEEPAIFASRSAGIALEMVSDRALVCMGVVFRVTAPGADSYTVNWYDGDRAFIGSTEESLADGVGTFESWVYVPSTEIIEVSATVDGVTYTDELRVDYASLGKTELVSTITSTEQPLLRQPYTLTWSAVEGASQYYLYWENSAGQTGEGAVKGSSFTFNENMFAVVGTYTFRIAAIQEGYLQGDYAEKTYTVSKTKVDDRVSVTADSAEILRGNTVKISVHAPGAEEVALYSTKGYRQVNEGNAEWELNPAATISYFGAAKYDGVWVYSDLLTVKVINNGPVVAPVISIPATVTVGQEMTVTWNPIENIQLYHVSVIDANGISVYDQTCGVSQTAVTIPVTFEAGTYAVKVTAQGDEGWEDSSSTTAFTVAHMGVLEQPVVTLKESFTAGELISVSWSAVDHAENYMLNLCDGSGKHLISYWIEAPETSAVMNDFLAEGTYYLYVYAMAEGWDSLNSEKAYFTVVGSQAEGPSFTVDREEVVADQTVTFTVSMDGATSFRLQCGGVYEFEAENGTATYTRTFYEMPGTVVEAKISACINGIWTAYGPARQITVLDKETLPQSAITVPEEAHAGDDIPLIWTAVENAGSYTVRVYDASEANVWSYHASGTETGTAIPAGIVKQGVYRVKIMAYGSGYYSSESDPVQLTVLAPLPGREFRYSLSYDGSEIQLQEYLGVPVPSEVVIPGNIGGIPVTDIVLNCLENAGTLKTVTIPASVTYISNTAFSGAEKLTICGYTGSMAENYAILNGHTFVALDDGKGDITASWSGDVLINGENTFTVSAPGATEVRMYRNGNKGYGTITLTETGANVIWKPTEATTYSLRFEALVNGQWLTTKNYPVQVTSYGEMPKVTNLKVTTDEREPCSDISISWTAPAGVEAAEYTAGIQKPSASIPTRFGVKNGETSHTFSGSWATEEGTYILSVEVEPQPGYEPSVTTITVELKSTKLWDYLASSKKVVAYHGTDKDVTIPAEIEGQPVTDVGDRIFEGSDLTAVTVSEGIDTIGTSAFESSKQLRSVTLPSTLEYIYRYAFADCEKLTDINLPAALRSIQQNAFNGCMSLTSVTIPEKIKTLESYTFYRCRALSQVVLPENLTTINYAAFGYCTSLKNITIPQSVSTIDSDAFIGCTGLTIYGYSGSEAERFAEAEGFDFVALDAAETGDISFTLENNRVYQYGDIIVSVDAPDAQKVRLHVNDEVRESSVNGGKAKLSYCVTSTGSYAVTVSQCVDGRWLAPCEKQTVTVVAMDSPVLEPILPVPAYTPVTVRWKPVEGAISYRLKLLEGTVQICEHTGITDTDEEGFICVELAASDLAKTGILTLRVTAYAADGGYSNGERSFEVTDSASAFTYELDEDGSAVITAFNGGETAVVPAQLEGHSVAKIAAQAFRNCPELKTITVADAQLTIAENAIVNCPALMSITLGPGVFVEHGAFDDCRTDMTVFGYSGGNVEDEARAVCRFSSIGELAAGPTVTAEDIWNNELLQYAVEKENAAKLYIVEVFPDGYVNRYTHIGNTLEHRSSISFIYEEEDTVVRLKATALIDGAWTAYTEKTVAVSIAKLLAPAEIPEIGPLARHLDHVISWKPVEHAESYDVTIFNNSDLTSWTLDASTTSVTLAAGSLEADDASSISITAKAKGYFESNATAEFQVYSMKLDTPEVTVEERIPRHLGATISWNAVEEAQWYTVTVVSEDGTHSICKDERVEGNSLYLEADDLEPDDYVVSVCANAQYCTTSDPAQGAFEVYEQKLETPEIIVESRIPRHLGAKIQWNEVAEAEWYTVTVVSRDGTYLRENRQVSGTEMKLYAHELEPDDYTVTVTAHAAYFEDSEPGREMFEVYLAPLDSPQITVADTVVGGVSYDVKWESVDDAEHYRVKILDGDGNELYSHYTTVAVPCSAILEAYLQECDLIVRVTAGAQYREDGTTEKQIHYKPLYAYEVVDGNVVITGYNGQDTDLFLPETINDMPVVAIGDSAFEGRTEIEHVYLPESVTEIGSKAFKNCIALERISGDGVKMIGDEAFYNCVSLSAVQFSRTGTGAIGGRDAFYRTPIAEDPDMDGLLDISVTWDSQSGSAGSYADSLFIGYVTYQEGITEIPERAHYNNLRLKEARLPKSLREIGSEAFAECPWLDGVYMYDGVEFIAEDAFDSSELVCLYIYTGSMSEVSYAEQYAKDHNIHYVKIFDYETPSDDDSPVVANYQKGTYGVPEKDHYGNSRLVAVKMADTVEFVENKAFAQCGALETVELHDTILSIADDAFQDSPNVEFILYVTDPERVSYAEQYALDHNIPCRKIVNEPETTENIDIGSNVDEAVYVEVDVSVNITVSDVPQEADRLMVYLDGQPIREMTIDQINSVSFSHTFRDFGEHVLTAEAYGENEIIKYSWKKPVIVTGIRLVADRRTAWVGEPVTFRVEAYPAVADVQLYAEDLIFTEAELAQGAADVTYAFTQAGSRVITARTYSGLASRELTLTIMCIGALEQPVLEAEQIQFVDDGLVCSWNTTANTDAYVLRVRLANGQEIASRNIADDGSGRMSCTIPAEELRGPGSYELYLMNSGYQYSQNESETVSVLMTADKVPAFTMDKQSVFTGEEVNFTFCAFGATKVELWADGEPIETVALVNYRANFSRAFTKSGAREIAVRAWSEEGWTDLTEVQILQVESRGKLEDVAVTAEPVQLVGNVITASWDEVEHADGYVVYFRNAANETLWKQTTQQMVANVPADAVKEAGECYFLVVAYGAGYDQSEGSTQVSVLTSMPGPVILTPAENETCTTLDVLLTWQEVYGAESYVVSLARKTEQTDANGVSIYEKVWDAPNETVNVGTAQRYLLTGLAYGQEYRVAVGTVVTLQDGTQRIGWTERLFSVPQPKLTVTLSADSLEVYERQSLTLRAVVNHTQTQAMLTDETGAVVSTSSAVSTVENGNRVFTFVLTEQIQGSKTYTVTVSGTDELTSAVPVADSISIEWLDADMPLVTDVRMEPANAWPGQNVTFTVEANVHTTKLDVYWVNGNGETFDSTLNPTESTGQANIFRFEHTFGNDGNYIIRFAPVNDYGEWTKGEYYSFEILPKGKLPAPDVTNLAQDDIVPRENYTVQWADIVLGEGMFFGGYSVTLYHWNDGWELIPGQDNVQLGMQRRYKLPVLTEGEKYRIEVYTLEEGTTVPSATLSGCTAIDFIYRAIPEFRVTAIETEEIQEQPVTVHWNAPVWSLDPVMKPDGYMVYWFRVGESKEVFAQKLDGKALSATLPGEYVKESGDYQVAVYALLGTQQRVHAGPVDFRIVPPDVEITTPKDLASWLNNIPLEIQGVVKGGVTQVLVQLLDENGNALELVDANGNKVTDVVVPAANGGFAVLLDPVKPLTESAEKVASFTVQVFGYLDGKDVNADQPADTDEWKFTVGEPQVTEITVNRNRDNYWLFHDEWMTATVNTNKAVTKVVLSDNGVLRKETFTAQDQENSDARVFTSAAFKIAAEGLHKIRVADANRADIYQEMNVYVVTRTAAEQVFVRDSVVLKSLPDGKGRDVMTVTPANTVVKKGVCRQYVLVVVDGNENLKGFVHEDLLKGTYVITYPFANDSIDFKNVYELEINWETYPGAVRYKVILTMEVKNKAGKTVDIPYEVDVPAIQGDIQKTVVDADELLNLIIGTRSFKDTTWPMTITIEAYGQ